MEGTRKTVRQKKLDRIAASIKRFGNTYTDIDEQRVREHLSNAIKELETASTLLTGYES